MKAIKLRKLGGPYVWIAILLAAIITFVIVNNRAAGHHLVVRGPSALAFSSLQKHPADSAKPGSKAKSSKEAAKKDNKKAADPNQPSTPPSPAPTPPPADPGPIGIPVPEPLPEPIPYPRPPVCPMGHSNGYYPDSRVTIYCSPCGPFPPYEQSMIACLDDPRPI